MPHKKKVYTIKVLGDFPRDIKLFIFSWLNNQAAVVNIQMMMKLIIITMLVVTTIDCSQALIRSDYGNGILYRMNATDDVFVYDQRNQNDYNFLIVGNHPGYPLKRTLVKFEDIPKACKSIKWAKMYIYF